jgi:cysteine desulfuration protein SufE
MPSITDTLDELAEEFELLSDWQEQLHHVMDMGKALPPLPEPEKTEANRVLGCQSRVWLVSERLPDGRLRFRADSDGQISRGNVALLLRLLSDRRPEEILGFDIRAALDRIGLPQMLTPARSNGLASMVARIRQEAAALQAAA